MAEVKPKNGRPPKYASEAELQETGYQYFDGLEAREMPSKAGLCLFLDISRDTYSEYRKKFPDTIRRFDSMIEVAWIQRLPSSSSSGSIFYLKNAFAYRDKQETDITSAGESIVLNDNQLDQLIKARSGQSNTKNNSD